MYQFLSVKKVVNTVMLVLMLCYQLVVPDIALGGRRWWCRHHSCYHDYGYHCSYYPNYGCNHEDDFFVRVQNELRYDATLALIVQNASNQLATTALLQGRIPQQYQPVQPVQTAVPAPVQLPAYQQQYQQPAYQQQQLPMQYQQIPQPVPQQYGQLPQPMNYVPQAGVMPQQQAPQPQQPFQLQQPQYYQPQQQPQGMGDPYPQQPPPLSGDQQQPQQPAGQQPTSVDVNTYLAGLKAAYYQIVVSPASTCTKCHGADKFATEGGGVDLSDLNKIDFSLAERIFFEVYTGNMPKGGQPLPKTQYDILSDYAFLLKNQQITPTIATPVPQSQP